MPLHRSGLATNSLLKEMWEENYLKRNKCKFEISSGSMRPLMEVGDVVTVRKIKPVEIRIGDITAFEDGGNVIVHRVIGKSRSHGQLYFRHIGDASFVSRLVSGTTLIGRVIVIEKERGNIRLDSRKYLIPNRISGWRLGLVDSVHRKQFRCFGINLKIVLGPVWNLGRLLLVRRY